MSDETKLNIREKVGLYCLLFVAKRFLRNLSEEESELLNRITWEVRYSM